MNVNNGARFMRQFESHCRHLVDVRPFIAVDLQQIPCNRRTTTQSLSLPFWWPHDLGVAVLRSVHTNRDTLRRAKLVPRWVGDLATTFIEGLSVSSLNCDRPLHLGLAQFLEPEPKPRFLSRTEENRNPNFSWSEIRFSNNQIRG